MLKVETQRIKIFDTNVVRSFTKFQHPGIVWSFCRGVKSLKHIHSRNKVLNIQIIESQSGFNFFKSLIKQLQFLNRLNRRKTRVAFKNIEEMTSWPDGPLQSLFSREIRSGEVALRQF